VPRTTFNFIPALQYPSTPCHILFLLAPVGSCAKTHSLLGNKIAVEIAPISRLLIRASGKSSRFTLTLSANRKFRYTFRRYFGMPLRRIFMSKLSRREATKMMLAATVMPSALTVDKPQAPPSAKSSKTWDVAVIGAGAFGAWSAYFLWKAGLRVILLDAYGPANSRASSGGESRIIRTA
jgi:FAD dependent oxidoreductase